MMREEMREIDVILTASIT